MSRWYFRIDPAAACGHPEARWIEGCAKGLEIVTRLPERGDGGHPATRGRACAGLAPSRARRRRAVINPYDDWLARAIVRAATPYSVRCVRASEHDGVEWWVLGADGWRMRCGTLAGARSAYTALRDGWLRIQQMAAQI